MHAIYKSLANISGICLLIAASSAHAKVFSFKNESVAAFLRGTGGMSQLHQDAFANSSGNPTLFDKDPQVNVSGEVGALFRVSDGLAVRIGLEAIRPQTVDAPGNNTVGAKLMDISSSVFVFNPNVTFEYVYSSTGSMRFYTYLGAGYSMVTVDNTYTIASPDGTAAFPGFTTYTEKLAATTTSGHAGFGFETLFTDRVTFAMDFGYRYLPVKELKHKAAVSTIAQPSAGAGDVAKNMDGSARKLDLGGIIIGASFRFYINF